MKCTYWLGLLAIASLAACTSVGPVGEARFLPMVEKATDVPRQDIVISSRVSWVPSNLDYCWMGAPFFLNCTDEENENLHKMKDHRDDYPARKDGVLIVTRSALIFLDWNDNTKSYAIDFSVPIKNVESLELHRFGLSRDMRVRVSSSRYVYYTLAIMGPQGQQEDKDKSERFFAYLKTQMGKNGHTVVY